MRTRRRSMLRRARPEPLAAAETRDSQLLTILDGLPVAVMLRAADGTLLHMNPATERFLSRLGLSEEHVASSPTTMLDHVAVIDEDGRPFHPPELPVVAAIREQRSQEATCGYALPEGGHAWYAVRAAPVPLSDGTTGTVVTLDDVTDRRTMERELRQAALKDPLTGVANRRALGERLVEAQRRRARSGGDIGLLYVDLDRFKEVNDTHGHDAGDRVLIEVARRLSAETREVDTVCRMGGDEFVVLCAPVDGPRGLDDLVGRIAGLPPVAVGETLVGASLGAVLVEPGEDLESALRRADTAMYRMKRQAP